MRVLAATAPCHTLDVVAPAPRATEPRRRRADGEATRARVLQATIESILEKGYYQTSSNEIARRAGVTWGAIQHLFGTREQLLLEVMNDRWHALQEQVATAQIQGETLEDRLAGVADVLSTHYGQPAALAQMQIMLDLLHDPNTSKETREAVAVHGERLVEAWEPLFAQALGPAANDFELVAFAFARYAASSRATSSPPPSAPSPAAGRNAGSSSTASPARCVSARRRRAWSSTTESPLHVRHRQVVERHDDVAHRQRVPALEATGEIQVDPA